MNKKHKLLILNRKKFKFINYEFNYDDKEHKV